MVGFIPARRTFMKSFICLRSIRLCSSRCSAAFSLLRNYGQPTAISDIASNAPLACLLRRQTIMRPISRARAAGSCVTYMSIPLMLGLCVICGYGF
jgi:hypothetical protein